ncbi:MAG TPA: glucose-6-phosphate isomerase [Candidatus Krumholzibacteria bacterium]|nr:glucose-6-phosphate isomerase [Candidatus Krumholzibacteria bacterium]
MDSTAGIRLDISGTEAFLPAADLDGLAGPVTAAAAELAAGTGPGSDFLGWLDLPARIGEAELAAVEAAAARLRGLADCCVVVGIGGSYLGARAVLEALGGPAPGAPELLFAGTGLCPATLGRVLDRVAQREPALCVISKSGTTLEPAVAFRLLRADLERRYGARAAERIVAITDARRGALKTMADEQGYATFVVPDDVGGRFSVLTPVGLVPLAVAGVDIRALVDGARAMRAACAAPDLRANPAHLYAAVRHALYRRGFTIEVLSSFHGGLGQVAEWWKQLFGESEGKGGQGIFPASTVMTTDLHSLGQYLQDGRRCIQETFLTVDRTRPEIAVPAGGADGRDLDGLDYLAGMPLDEINRRAFAGTRAAHLAGGVPCTALALETVDARSVGALLYLFEKAVAVSGRLLGVNPFDQPGVEAYKKEMFRLLGKR